MTVKAHHINIYLIQLKQCYRKKGITSSVYIRKEKSPKIHSLSFHHKQLKPVKTKVEKRKEWKIEQNNQGNRKQTIEQWN